MFGGETAGLLYHLLCFGFQSLPLSVGAPASFLVRTATGIVYQLSLFGRSPVRFFQQQLMIVGVPVVLFLALPFVFGAQARHRFDEQALLLVAAGTCCHFKLLASCLRERGRI
jgi:hypothetical protein